MNNHSPYFPSLVTGIVDTFLVEVWKPLNGELNRALYNPKYNATVYKVKLVLIVIYN